MSTTTAAAVAADVMVRAPKVHEPALTVGELRAAFADDHVHMLLLVDQGRLRGTVVRDDVPPDAPAAGPALDFAATSGRTVGPDEPVKALRTVMLAAGLRRLAVVDGQGSLLGLLCLKRHLGGFCSDADVAARRGNTPGCP